jgi:hypothetical protein
MLNPLILLFSIGVSSEDIEVICVVVSVKDLRQDQDDEVDRLDGASRFRLRGAPLAGSAARSQALPGNALRERLCLSCAGR